MKDNKIIVAHYMRGAYEEQVENQKRRLKEYSENKGQIVCDHYIDKDPDRFMMQKMLEDMKKGKFKKIVIYDPTRLSRNFYELAKLTIEIEDHGCELEYADDSSKKKSCRDALKVCLFRLFIESENEYKRTCAKD